MAKRDYTTSTEKAKDAFESGLESLDTQRERREVLEKATELIAEKTEESIAEPEVVPASPWGKNIS